MSRIPDFRFDQGGFGLSGPAVLIEADTSRGVTQLNNFNKLVDSSARSMVSSMRAAVSFASQIAVVFGNTTQQMYTVLADAVISSIETVLAINAAITASTIGFNWATFKLGTQITSVLALWVTFYNIVNEKQRNAQKTYALATALRMIAYRIVLPNMKIIYIIKLTVMRLIP